MKTLSTVLILLFSFAALPANISPKGDVSDDKVTVLICTNKYSKHFHNSNCKNMKRCNKDIRQISLATAKKMSLLPCKKCYKKKD